MATQWWDQVYRKYLIAMAEEWLRQAIELPEKRGLWFWREGDQLGRPPCLN